MKPVFTIQEFGRLWDEQRRYQSCQCCEYCEQLQGYPVLANQHEVEGHDHKDRGVREQWEGARYVLVPRWDHLYEVYVGSRVAPRTAGSKYEEQENRPVQISRHYYQRVSDEGSEETEPDCPLPSIEVSQPRDD